MRRILLIGCGGLVAVFVLLIILVAGFGAGGGNQPPTPPSPPSSSPPPPSSEPTVGINQTATAGEVAWTVTDARRASQLTDPLGQTKQGNFVIVDFNFQNNGSQAVTLDTASLALVDSQNRTSKADPDVFEYVDPNKQIFLKQVNPGVTQQGEAIFTVAPDASGFKLQAADANPFTNKTAYVDLGF